jgi:hypothetical protein
MSTIDQFQLALQAYQEIQAELHQKETTLPDVEKVPAHDQAADRITPLPEGSLLLGLAEDGLPLMLDLYDPAPGPLLVAGDRGSGKTGLLKSLAQASDCKNPGDIQFGVITPFPEEWTEQEALPNCLGIWPACHPAATDFLSQMVSWADALPRSRQVVLVLVDGLDLLTAGEFRIQQDLRWLLMYGPERQVWPVVTVNPGHLTHPETWLDYFQTRILGQVKRQETARSLINDSETNLAVLEAGTQFGLSRPDGWLKFWFPPIEQGDRHGRWNVVV